MGRVIRGAASSASGHIGGKSRFSANDSEQNGREAFVHLEQVAQNDGFDKAWRAIIDPWFVMHPKLLPISAANAHWTVSATTVAPSTRDDDEPTSAEAVSSSIF